MRIRPLFFALILLCTPAASLLAQQSAPASPPSKADFLATADEVLHDMSVITGWKLNGPLKKSLLSREEIHAYVIRQMDDEKDAKERYASARSAEAFGLIPRGFNLDAFLVELLTEQIAGLYDPKTHEFYIADWIAVEDQRMVMSHELTHALEDQQFHIEEWVHAARPNDDAEMAREAVLEGSAMAAMVEYMFKDKGIKLSDLPDIDPSLFVGDLGDTPTLKKAPPFIKDTLLFPYFSGLTFSIAQLKTGSWPAFSKVFAKPPANTQQILHPEAYRLGKLPPPIKLDLPATIPPKDWVKLEENSMGELGWKEVLKQFLDEGRAKEMAAAWNGDMYATYEQKESKRLLLFTRIRFDSEANTTEFFAQYSEALEKKYPTRTHRVADKNLLSFDSPDGPVFLRCQLSDCITQEGGDPALFPQWLKQLGWSAQAVTTGAI